MDKKKFSKEILPKHFRTSNFSSFVRQLNFYRFTKCLEKNKKEEKGQGIWVFMHENFIRDRPDLLSLVKRRTYQDQETAKEIATLKETVSTLVERVKMLENMIGVQSTVDDNKNQPPQKKRKRSCEDFDEQPGGEMMDLDSTKELATFLEDMDFDDTSRKVARNLPSNIISRPPSLRRSPSWNPSLCESPSWESVCENVSVPDDVSSEDAAKVGEVLSYLMPQIQQALLNQMSMTDPTISV